MKISGDVTSKGQPIANASVVLRIPSTNFEVTTYADDAGHFQHGTGGTFIGKSLICRVSKEGFLPKEEIRLLESQDVHFEIELLPVPPLRITGHVTSQGQPIADASVLLKVASTDFEVTTYTDDAGRFQHETGGTFIGKSLICRVSKEGFVAKEEPPRLLESQDAHFEIELLPKPDKPWWPPPWWPLPSWLLIAVAVIGVVVFALLFFSSKAKISQFVADPQKITKGEPSVLQWKVQNASEVILKQDSYEKTFSGSGSVEVTPTKTAEYSLVAKDKRGRIVDSKNLEITVIPPPKIVRFEARPKGKGFQLQWLTKDATEISLHEEPLKVPPGGHIPPQRLKVPSDSLIVTPTQRTVYRLVATNELGKMDKRELTLEPHVTGAAPPRPLPPPPIGAVSCIHFDPRRLSVYEEGKLSPDYLILEGDREIYRFHHQQGGGAQRTLDVIRHYNIDQLCLLGGHDHPFKYMLIGNTAPAGELHGEDCNKFGKLQVKDETNQWKLMDNDRELYAFDNQNEAQEALKIIEKYGFDHVCYVYGKYTGFRYLRK